MVDGQEGDTRSSLGEGETTRASDMSGTQRRSISFCTRIAPIADDDVPPRVASS